jgi:hypothetical protein
VWSDNHGLAEGEAGHFKGPRVYPWGSIILHINSNIFFSSLRKFIL